MTKRHVPFLLLILLVAVVCTSARSVHAQAFTVNVDCIDFFGECRELLTPNPINIPVGGAVQWNLFPSCANAPCSGICTVTVPRGEGFNGFQQQGRAPGQIGPTPQFESEGVFPYRLECSPPLIGTIIVGGANSR